MNFISIPSQDWCKWLRRNLIKVYLRIGTMTMGMYSRRSGHVLNRVYLYRKLHTCWEVAVYAFHQALAYRNRPWKKRGDSVNRVHGCCTIVTHPYLRAKGLCLASRHSSKPRPVRRHAFFSPTYGHKPCRCRCDLRLRAFQTRNASHAALLFSSPPNCFPLAQPEAACPRSSSSSSKITQNPFRSHSLTRPEPDLATLCDPAGIAARLREYIFASCGKSQSPLPNDVESGKVVVLGTS